MLSSVFMSPLGSLCRTHLVQGDWEGGFLPEFFVPEKWSCCFFAHEIDLRGVGLLSLALCARGMRGPRVPVLWGHSDDAEDSFRFAYLSVFLPLTPKSL